MTKLSILICVAVLACAATPAVREAAVASESRWDPDETAPTVHDVASAAAYARVTHCRTSSCDAIIVIHKLADIELYQLNDGNGVPMLGNRPKIAGRRLDRTLLDHPELYGPVCAMGVKLVSRVHAGSDIFMPIQLLMHGVDMDLRDHGHCAQDLVAALPRDPANDQIRINARDLCITNDENHHRSKAACAVLAQGVKEKQ